MTRAEFVIVTGIPSSGNRLVWQLLWDSLGFKQDTELLFDHFAPRAIGRIRQEHDDVRVILCLREEAALWRSIEARWPGGYHPGMTLDDHHLKQWYPTLDAVAGCPCLPVRYGDIIADPDRVGRTIARFLGVPWTQWHTPIYDGNAKHRGPKPAPPPEPKPNAPDCVVSPLAGVAHPVPGLRIPGY